MYDIKGMKEAYLNTLTEASRRRAVGFFNQIEYAEEKMGKDILELTDSELFHFLKNIKWNTEDELSNKKTYYGGYFKFHNNPYFSEYNINELRVMCTFTGDFILSYEEIKEIEKAVNSIENGWYYNAILFSVFYGFSIKPVDDFLNLRVRNVDFDGNKIKFDNGREIDMTDKPELSTYLKAVIENKCEYASSNASGEYRGINEDSVFKVSTTKRTRDVKKALERSITERAIKKIKLTSNNDNLTLTKLSYSGLLYDVRTKIVKSGLDAVTYVNDYRNDMEIQRSIVDFHKTISLSKFRFMLKNYLNLLEIE